MFAGICVAASEPFSLPASYFVERKQKETRLDMKFAAVAAESAARNERLVQVSNKRITSFGGFQKISGCVSAPSGSPREPRPFADGGGGGAIHPSGEVTFAACGRKQTCSLIHMESLI